MRSFPYIALCFFVAMNSATAQVRVNKAIELTGTDADQRQVHGVPSTAAPDALLNAEMELTGMHRYATPATGNLWEVVLTGLDEAPIPGTHIIVKAPAPTAGPLQIQVNGHGPFPVTRGATEQVQGEEIPEGTMLSLVHDGTAFQLINGVGHSPRACPDGMVAVNDQYCIQAVKYPLSEFWPAIEQCGSQGYRLCTWGEYFAACSNAGTLGILDLPSGWEWTNNTANEDMSVRVVGHPSCYGAGTGELLSPVTPRFYRCCFTR